MTAISDIILDLVITVVIILMTKKLMPYLETITTDAQRKKIWDKIKIAVNAAEQLFIGSGRGEEKKEYVENELDKDSSISSVIDKDERNTMIEAAVYDLKSSK